MGLFSKIIGGYLGFSLGGPLGALAGVALASLLEGGQRTAHSAYQFSNQEESQTVFFVATFSLLGKLAKVDGRVSREEIEVIEKFMYHELKLDPRSASFAEKIFTEAKDSSHDYKEFASQFATHFRAQPQMLQGMLDLLLRVAAADGTFDPVEERFINNVKDIFGTADSVYEHLKKKHVKATGHHYSVLGLDPSCTNEELKRQYKKLVLENHPDRVVSQGMPEEFKKLAEDKFHEIQEAYESICQERGV